MRRRINLFLLILSFGCTNFPSRSFSDQMDLEEYSFFKPQEDFPVIGGDNGEYWTSDEERIQRTPEAEKIMSDERRSLALKSELQQLEESQVDEDARLYEAHKNKFNSQSEKIYFLNLLSNEREEYLLERGFIRPSAPERRISKLHNYSDRNEKSEISDENFFSSDFFMYRKHDVSMGMNKQEVLKAMGKPLRVEVAGNPRYENERWLYELNGASRYIYFESGEVHGWD